MKIGNTLRELSKFQHELWPVATDDRRQKDRGIGLGQNFPSLTVSSSPRFSNGAYLFMLQGGKCGGRRQ